MSHRRRRGRRLAVAAVLLGIGALVELATPAAGAPELQPVAAQASSSTAAPPTTLPPRGGATASSRSLAPGGGPATSTTLGLVPVQPPADPGLFDIPGRIRKAIDQWFQGVVAAAVSPALDLLGRTLLATPGVATGDRARELWRVSLGLADGAYVLLVTIAGVVLLAVLLAATCVVRALLVVFLVVAAPVLLAAHALPQTEGLARLWWRAMAACLGVQLVQALTLAMAVRVFFEADRGGVLPLGGGHLVDVLVACCLLWLLIRIPAWAARLVLEGGRRSTLVRLVRGMIVVRTIGGVRDAVGAIR